MLVKYLAFSLYFSFSLSALPDGLNKESNTYDRLKFSTLYDFIDLIWRVYLIELTSVLYN